MKNREKCTLLFKSGLTLSKGSLYTSYGDPVKVWEGADNYWAGNLQVILMFIGDPSEEANSTDLVYYTNGIKTDGYELHYDIGVVKARNYKGECLIDRKWYPRNLVTKIVASNSERNQHEKSVPRIEDAFELAQKYWESKSDFSNRLFDLGDEARKYRRIYTHRDMIKLFDQYGINPRILEHIS